MVGAAAHRGGARDGAATAVPTTVGTPSSAPSCVAGPSWGRTRLLVTLGPGTLTWPRSARHLPLRSCDLRAIRSGSRGVLWLVLTT